MLDDITQTAVSILQCKLAWLLTREDDTLATQSVSYESEDVAASFFATIESYYENGRFPLQAGHNPFAEILLRNTPLVGLETPQLATIDGGNLLMSALMEYGFNYISIVPLRKGDHLMGVLVLTADTPDLMTSSKGHMLVKMLRRQAVLEIDHHHLVVELNESETQHALLHDFYGVVLDTIGDGLVITDLEGKITYLSNRLMVMSEYGSDELIGKKLSEIFSEASRPTIEDALGADKRKTLSLTQELQTKSGDIVPVLLSRVVTKEIAGQDKRFVIVLSDLSRLRANEQALERQTQRLRVLNRAAQAISSPLSLNEVIQIILSSAREIVQGMVASILLRDVDEPENLIIIASLGEHADRRHGRIVPSGIGIVGWVAEHSESLLVPNVSKDSRFLEGLDSDYGVETQSIAAVPLIASNEVIGVLEVINKENGVFDPDDLEVLENLGSSAAIAIQNASLFDQIQRRLTELSTLLDASAVVTSTLDLGAVLEHITHSLRKALDLQRVVVSTVDLEQDELNWLVEVVDAEWSFNQAPTIDIESLPAKEKALRHKQATSASVDFPDLYANDCDELHVRGMHCVLNYPWQYNDETIGLISLYHEQPLTFNAIHNTALSDTLSSWQQSVQNPWEDLTELCRRTLHATNLNWCSLYRWNPKDNTLQLVREMGNAFWQESLGLPQTSLELFPTIRQVVATGDIQKILTNELPDFSEEKNYYSRIGTSSSLIAPLIIHGQPVGVVQLMTTDQREFDSSAFSLSMGISNVVGNALENASLYSSLEKRAEALESAYRELEEADRLKDDLLQNLSHELGTPMTHILGYISLLKDGTFGPMNKEQQEAAQTVIEKIEQVASLIKKMVSVHASNSQNLSLKSTRLEQIVALAIRSMSPKAKSSSIQLVPQMPEGLPPALVDRVAISEIFEALIDNAIKFSGEGTRIEISIADLGGPTLQVNIRDQGIGIPSTEHEKVFRRFYQIDGSTTRRYGGTGLGLAIARKVITAHGGRIWLESDLDKGTTVSFTVPKATLEHSPTDTQSAFA